MDPDVLNDVKAVLRDALGVGERVGAFGEHTLLLGELPELDSMAVVALLTALEERFDFVVYDDEISAATFYTLGSLGEFVARKMKD